MKNNTAKYVTVGLGLLIVVSLAIAAGPFGIFRGRGGCANGVYNVPTPEPEPTPPVIVVPDEIPNNVLLHVPKSQASTETPKNELLTKPLCDCFSSKCTCESKSKCTCISCNCEACPLKTKVTKKIDDKIQDIKDKYNIEVEHDWNWAKAEMLKGAKVCKSDPKGIYYYITDGTTLHIESIDSNNNDYPKVVYLLWPGLETDGKWWKIANFDNWVRGQKVVAASGGQIKTYPDIDLADPIDADDGWDVNWAIKQMKLGYKVRKKTFPEDVYFYMVGNIVYSNRATNPQLYFSKDDKDTNWENYLQQSEDNTQTSNDDCDSSYDTSYSRPGFFRRVFGRR